MNGPAFHALLLADARLPTGSFAYSAGLEPAVIAGLTIAEVYPYMLARLATITRLESSACVLAHRLAADQAPASAYARLERAVDARTPSQVQRRISRTLGRAMLRLAQSLRLRHLGLDTLAMPDTPPTRGTALGVLSHALDVDERTSAEICCYQDLQSIAAAALKLLPVAPATATHWVLDAEERAVEVVEEACAVRDCMQLPASCAPWMEFHAQEHALRTRRLFHA